MKVKVSLIKIVKRPIDKNCWLSVDENLELKAEYSECIEYYDFIDFEGQVFYYDVLDSLIDCFTDDFIYTGNTVVSDSVKVKELKKFVKKEFKNVFIKRFSNVDSMLKIDILAE